MPIYERIVDGKESLNENQDWLLKTGVFGIVLLGVTGTESEVNIVLDTCHPTLYLKT